MSTYEPIPCTGCRACLSLCQVCIDIPGIFSAWNNLASTGDVEHARSIYKKVTGGMTTASTCLGCDGCRSSCPNDIWISLELDHIAEVFDA